MCGVLTKTRICSKVAVQELDFSPFRIVDSGSIDTIHMDRKLPTMCGGSCVLHRKLHPQSSHGSIMPVLHALSSVEEFSLEL